MLSLLDGDQCVVGIFNQAVWRAQPPRHFLVRAGSLVAGAMLSRAPSSDSNSCYYAIVRGGGKRRENRERGEWGNDRKRSNKMKARWKRRSKTQHNCEETLLSIPLLQASKNEDQLK